MSELRRLTNSGIYSLWIYRAENQMLRNWLLEFFETFVLKLDILAREMSEILHVFPINGGNLMAPTGYSIRDSVNKQNSETAQLLCFPENKT